ncbi:MAG: hypothetical protein KBS91_00310, partial [Firmicutes bacterium]|nr:hypothetical protein [Candidatus Caballimonas caccae]
MLNDILQFNNGNNSIVEFADCIRQEKNLAVFGVNESFKNYLVSIIDRKVLFIVKDLLTARNYQTLLEEMSNKKVVVLPCRDEVLIPLKAFSKDTYFERIIALSKLSEADIVIVTMETLLQPCMAIEEDLSLEKGQNIEIPTLVEKLVALGYCRCETVESKGFFSVRGDIVDIFPISSLVPFKIDFFGDEIESIKQYDLDTRKTVAFVTKINISSSKES